MPDRDILTVMNENAEQLMARPDVVMMAIGELADGTPCIQIYVRDIQGETVKKIGANLGGHPVDYILSDEVRPLN